MADIGRLKSISLEFRSYDEAVAAGKIFNRHSSCDVTVSNNNLIVYYVNTLPWNMFYNITNIIMNGE